MPRFATAYHTRWMIRRDMPEVLAIEAERYSSPWVEEDFLACLRQRNCIGMVAEQGERVVGYMIYELHRRRFEVLNLAVAADASRQGVGTAMLAKLKKKLDRERRQTIGFNLRDGNLPGHLFLRAQGFRCRGILPGYFADTAEPAYRFVHTLTE